MLRDRAVSAIVSAIFSAAAEMHGQVERLGVSFQKAFKEPVYVSGTAFVEAVQMYLKIYKKQRSEFGVTWATRGWVGSVDGTWFCRRFFRTRPFSARAQKRS